MSINGGKKVIGNIALRGLTLASKFVFFFFLARYLEPAEVGLYGLVTVTITYALYFLGLDFYTFTTRELIRTEPSRWAGILKSHIALSGLLYALFLPLCLVIFATNLLPWSVVAWFYLLLVLEHWAQELGRLLVALNEQLTASWLLLFRSGLWSIGIIALMVTTPGTRTLSHILAAWGIGAAIGLGVGAAKLRGRLAGGWHCPVNWTWVRAGVRVALPLLGATLALRALFTVDRFWFEFLVDRSVLGAYVLFMGVVNALPALLEAGVFSFSYPALVAHCHAGDKKTFGRTFLRLTIGTAAVVFLYGIIASVLLDFLLGWLDRPVYAQNKDLFYLLLLAMAVYVLSMIPHYALYAQGEDRPIIRSHIAGLVAFLAATWLAELYSPRMAVPTGLCAAFTVILVWKATALQRCTFWCLRAEDFRGFFKTQKEKLEC